MTQNHGTLTSQNFRDVGVSINALLVGYLKAMWICLRASIWPLDVRLINIIKCHLMKKVTYGPLNYLCQSESRGTQKEVNF
jgi:hypothetical protein